MFSRKKIEEIARDVTYHLILSTWFSLTLLYFFHDRLDYQIKRQTSTQKMLSSNQISTSQLVL